MIRLLGDNWKVKEKDVEEVFPFLSWTQLLFSFLYIEDAEL